MPNLKDKMVKVYMSMSDEIRKIVPDTVREIKMASIDLDFTGLSVADIFRNLNTLYPKMSRERGMIKSGTMVICVITKSELMNPYKGIVFLITNGSLEIKAYSKKYMLFVIDEDHISDEDDVLTMVSNLTKYLIHNCKNDIDKLQDFFLKYVYDPGEEKRDNERILSET